MNKLYLKGSHRQDIGRSVLIAARLRWAVGCPADGQLLGPDGFLRPHSDPLPVNVLTDDQACHSPQMQVYFHACELLISE